MMGKDIKVIVAAHKKYEMPKDKMYVPVQVGAEGKKDIGYTKDNTGDNISSNVLRAYWSVLGVEES